MSPINQLAEVLQSLSDPVHGSEFYAHELERLIQAVDESDGYPAHEKFARICDLADLSFPPGTPSENEIRDNPVTAPLMTFLIRGLRSYRLRASQANPSSTTKRRELLSSCFGLDTGTQGGDTRGKQWSLRQKQDFLWEFTEALGNKTDGESWRVAFIKTYRLAFGDDALVDRTIKLRMKNRTQLESLLAEHGYKAEWYQVNLKNMAMS